MDYDTKTKILTVTVFKWFSSHIIFCIASNELSCDLKQGIKDESRTVFPQNTEVPLSIAFTVAQAELVCHKVALMYISVPVFSSWVYQGHLSLTNISVIIFYINTGSETSLDKFNCRCFL